MRIIICEDEALIRRGLELMLQDAGHQVMATVENVEELNEVLRTEHPTLVITDIRMPPTFTDEGLQAALRIRRTMPDIAVVVLSQHVHRAYAQEIVNLGDGQTGYLLKQRISDVDVFIETLERIESGATVLDPDVVAVMLDRASQTEKAVQQLTPRQREVLALIAEGRSNANIASVLFLTEKAIVQHVSRIYTALGLAVSSDNHRRVQAVTRFLNGN